jgi:ribosomal protein S18 acetylase RimI-like enzyme
MSAEIVLLADETAPLLSRVAEGVFDRPIDPAQLKAFLADPRHLMLLAVVSGEVVGMASGIELLHPDKKPQLFVNEIGVAPAHQRRGIGRRLVAGLIGAARARGCASAWLGTAADNAAGRALFAASGAASPPEPFLLYEWGFDP